MKYSKENPCLLMFIVCIFHIYFVYFIDSEKDRKKYKFGLYKQVLGVVGEVGNSRACRDSKIWVEVFNWENLMRVAKMKGIMNIIM